jgi:hypothetical protein
MQGLVCEARRTLVRAVRARWACEQAHQQLKDDLFLKQLY